MKKGPIIVLVLAACIFAASFMLPRGSAEAWREKLSAKTGSLDLTPRVQMTEVESPHLQGNVLTLVGTSMAVPIRARKGTDSRKLLVRPEGGQVLRVRFEPAADEKLLLPVPDRTVTAQEPLELFVGEGGGVVTIAAAVIVPGIRIHLE